MSFLPPTLFPWLAARTSACERPEPSFWNLAVSVVFPTTRVLQLPHSVCAAPCANKFHASRSPPMSAVNTSAL